MQTNLNFSSRTTSLDVQMILEANVAKRNKNIYGPPIGKKLVCFVDDMNMPQVDTYGTQQPIALLKLFLESGGMYDRGKELIWKSLIEICELISNRVKSFYSIENITNVFKICMQPWVNLEVAEMK